MQIKDWKKYMYLGVTPCEEQGVGLSTISFSLKSGKKDAVPIPNAAIATKVHKLIKVEV